MKNKILFFTLFIFTALSVFADKSRFYEDDKVIDTMYVDSAEGLRVRSKPSLKSDKLCVLPNMIQVKVVAIGREEKIDSITAPWVEILIPRYEWKTEEPEYGWVFGGYLGSSRNNQEALPLELRLQIFNWIYYWNGNKCSIDFCAGGFNSKTFDFFYELNDEDAGGCNLNVTYRGKWTVKGDTVFFEGARSVCEDEYIWKEENYKSRTGRDEIDACDILRFKPFSLTGAFEVKMPYGYKSLVSMEIMTKLKDEEIVFMSGYVGENNSIDFSKPYIYYKAFSDFADERDEYYNPLIRISGEESEKYKNLIYLLIKAGVDPRGSDYIDKYHNYWNPIMAEHQKKADALTIE